ncbi:NAD(P)/FAD-dependent oxidoreductase [Candidatus Microgenomates bacterium]|nr:NAD(P)/FAD-dependent oxidoreductase [Candidatus Microgenomates bacterium]
MRIAILGAGITGLTAAFRLSQQGHQVTLFEKEPFVGGLAAGFKNKDWEWPLERFYHHFFAGDRAVIDLIKDLDLKKQLFFKKPLTAIYYPDSTKENTPPSIHPFDSPIALFRFPHLSLFEKIRTGTILAYLKTLSNYKSLEQTTAAAWLKKTMGKNSFKILWEPLLKSKFGDFADQVTAAWFWARIKKRTKSLGYLEGGFQTLAKKLEEKIRENKGKILLKTTVKEIKSESGKIEIGYFYAGKINHQRFDKVICTLPTSPFLEITKNLPENYSQKLSAIPHLWAQTLILEIDKPFLNGTYWLNINDLNLPFLAVVEHTNFIDKSHYGKRHILYVGNYLPHNHPFLEKNPTDLLAIFTPYLQRINPDFNTQFAIYNLRLFSAPHAQPVITIGHQPPPWETPIKNLYLANLDSVYPWDRGTNYAVEAGEKVAELVSGV